MAVPKQRHTKSRRNKRRGNIFITPPAFTVCSKCGKQILPHVACPNCGFYKGREVIDVMKKLNKKEKKMKKKELAAKEKEQKTAKSDLNWEGLSKKE